MPTNKDLKAIYDQTYADGTAYAGWHTDVDTFEESMLIYEMGKPWRGKRVLEIGCGEGRLAALLAMAGAEYVLGVDYSEPAIAHASEHWHYPCCFRVIKNEDHAITLALTAKTQDIFVMQGVLEHLDDWQGFLAQCFEYGSCVITSSPNFLNPRGYILQALRLLLDVPTSLTDLHYFSPADFEAFAAKHSKRLTYRSCHHDWASGQTMLADFRKRLPNALRDAGLPTENVPKLLEWLEKLPADLPRNEDTGATVVYRFD